MKHLLFIFFFFSLLGCHRPSSLWKYDCISASSPPVRYGRLSYIPKTSLNLIKPEVTHANKCIRLYLNLCLCPLEEQGEIPFHFFIQNQQETGTVSILEGGQRLLVDPESANKIITALYEGNCVKIEVGFYDEVIEPIGFKQLYPK